MSSVFIEVREATPHDLPVLESAWPTGGVNPSHMVAVERGDASFLVAFYCAAPVGVGLVRWVGPTGEQARLIYPHAVEVAHLQVRSGYRRRGVATALVHAAEGLVRRRGPSTIAVGVADDNTNATRLYWRLGFERTGIIDRSEYDWFDERRGRQFSPRHRIRRATCTRTRLTFAASPAARQGRRALRNTDDAQSQHQDSAVRTRGLGYAGSLCG